MLILGRREGDAILIGDNIRLVVLACDRKGVRLGIEAPPHITILREEIIRDVTEENLRAEVIPTNEDWLDLIAGLRPGEPSTIGSSQPSRRSRTSDRAAERGGETVGVGIGSRSIRQLLISRVLSRTGRAELDPHCVVPGLHHGVD